jgi:predicted nucleic acid-binding protein
MRLLDASSIIHGWDNYPIRQMPRLWQWVALEIEQEELRIPVVAREEVRRKCPECAKWLNENEIQIVRINNEILHESLRIKRILGIQGDKFHPNGVGENDVIIIATAKVQQAGLISNESKQLTKMPKSNGDLKIPAVCMLPDVRVNCIDFVEYFKQSGAVF